MVVLATLLACVSKPKPADVNNVLVVSELTQTCRYIRMQNCESLRENGDRQCYKRLKELAAEAGADTVLVDEIIDHAQMTQLNNNAFGDKKTIVESRFYQCNTP